MFEKYKRNGGIFPPGIAIRLTKEPSVLQFQGQNRKSSYLNTQYLFLARKLLQQNTNKIK